MHYLRCIWTLPLNIPILFYFCIGFFAGSWGCRFSESRVSASNHHDATRRPSSPSHSSASTHHPTHTVPSPRWHLRLSVPGVHPPFPACAWILEHSLCPAEHILFDEMPSKQGLSPPPVLVVRLYFAACYHSFVRKYIWWPCWISCSKIACWRTSSLFWTCMTSFFSFFLISAGERLHVSPFCLKEVAWSQVEQWGWHFTPKFTCTLSKGTNVSRSKRWLVWW